MITRLTHATVMVLDQDQALDFYVNKLGFTVSMDITTATGFRWLTVSPPKQPDFNLNLMKIEPGDVMNEKTASLVTELLAEGAMPTGVFECDDCRATFAELSARGVKFLREPTDHFFGVESAFVDPFGNSFTLVERKKP
jgi:catechol 2,3-dioxygenase-like lactoylglutathione lyase family enzyme